MGSDVRFTAGLAGWVLAIAVALVGGIAAFWTPGLAAVRIVAIVLVAGAVIGLWRHVTRTNMMLARFVEALTHGDFAARFDVRGGAGFAALAGSLDGAMRRLHAERTRSAEDQRYLDALVDDMPVALLIVAAGSVTLRNRAARALFADHDGVRPEDFARYGASFAALLGGAAGDARELVILNLPRGPQRAVVRVATLHRLGAASRAVTVQPVQGALDAVEVAAQTDLVRVLTHELLNSLTPVTSLAATAAQALAAEPPDPETARTAMATVSRRIGSLHRFVQSYRSVANEPVARLKDFAADSFAQELIRLVGSEWPAVALTAEIERGAMLRADPDLLAQAIINLLRNAAQAADAGVEAGGDPCVTLGIVRDGGALTIVVADNGGGVPEALRREIFLPFYTTRAEGTGIGLNLVRQVVVAHGWSIDVGTSALGGAAFTIRTTRG